MSNDYNDFEFNSLNIPYVYASRMIKTKEEKDDEDDEREGEREKEIFCNLQFPRFRFHDRSVSLALDIFFPPVLSFCVCSLLSFKFPLSRFLFVQWHEMNTRWIHGHLVEVAKIKGEASINLYTSFLFALFFALSRFRSDFFFFHPPL